MRETNPPRRGRSHAVAWLARRLAAPAIEADSKRPSAARLIILCSVVFLAALGVRLLHWQDNYLDMSRKGTMPRDLVKPYWQEAAHLLEDGSLVFPRRPVDTTDARMLLHPPGYSILLAGLFRLLNDTQTLLKHLQIYQLAIDSVAAALVFLIAAELLPLAVALIASLLVALSPHLAYYSLWLSPDSLSALPVLLAIYFIARATQRPTTKQSRIIYILAAGVMIGVSCWLRSNALLLAPFLAASVFLVVERGKRIMYSLALVSATILTISPITIRNWVVYNHFIPLSLATGLNLIQGIAEFDKEDKFGMPLGDREAEKTDAEWHNRADYANNLWKPDGIARDRYRFARGLEVIRSNPGWFLTAMVRRVAFMLSYNESRRRDWPFYTATVPIVSPDPTFCHWPASDALNQPVWATTAAEAINGGTIASPQAEVTLTADNKMIQITGDDTVYDNQFIFASFSVRENTDYLLSVPVRLKQGYVSIRVTSADNRITIASALPDLEEEINKRLEKDAPENIPLDAIDRQPFDVVHIPFASDDKVELRLVVSNNDATPLRPVVEVGEARLYELGATPYKWAQPARLIIRGIQGSLYATGIMRALVIAGIALLVIAGQGRTLVILLAAPAYYLSTHSAFSTEYRYILAIHYFLFMMAAVTIYCAITAAVQTLKKLRKNEERK